MTKLQSAGVPAGVVQTGADLLKDAQLRHRNYFASFPDSLIGPFEIPRSGILFRGMTEEPLGCPIGSAPTMIKFSAKFSATIRRRSTNGARKKF